MQNKSISFWLLSSLVLAINSPLSAGEGERTSFFLASSGARAGALGGAFTALADDPTAITANPAGLAFLRGSFYAEHMPVYNGGRENTLAFTIPSKFGGFGFGLIQFRTDGIEKRLDVSDSPVETEAQQTVWILPYGIGFKNFSAGVSLKRFEANLDNNKDTAYGADAGALFTHSFNDWGQFQDPELRLGLSIKNIYSPTLVLIREGEKVPRAVSFGLVIRGSLFSGYHVSKKILVTDRVGLSLDVVKEGQNNILPRTGIEYLLRDMIALRLGYAQNMSFGLGYGHENSPFEINYALITNELIPQHRFSFTYYLTPPKPRARLSPELRQLKNTRTDAKRYRDNLLAEGRKALREANYDQALTSFDGALVLDPSNEQIKKFIERSQEASRTRVVNEALKQVKLSLEKGIPDEAIAQLFRALKTDPENRDVKEALSSTRSGFLSLSRDTRVAYDKKFSFEINQIRESVRWAMEHKKIEETRNGLLVLRAADADNRLTIQLSKEAEGFFAEEFNRHMDQAALALSKEEFATAHLSFRQAAEILPDNRDLNRQQSGLIASYLKKMAFKKYDRLYQDQLYQTAALHYVRGNLTAADEKLTDLLSLNVVHGDGNFLREKIRKKRSVDENSYE